MKRKQQEKKEKRQNELSIIDPILLQTKQIKSTSRFFKQIYGCAYARRYKVNQATKGTPGVIKAATNDIKNIAEKRTNQIISEVGKVIECVLPEIIHGTTEDVSQTPFRLLGELPSLYDIVETFPKITQTFKNAVIKNYFNYQLLIKQFITNVIQKKKFKCPLKCKR